MTIARLNIFTRVIKRRIESGESLEQILDGYSKLTKEEKQEVREVFQDGGKIND